MAVGNQAKEKLIQKIIDALGDSYIGMKDKKYYFNSDENGERIQIAISMTCPKIPIGEVGATTDSNVLNFEDGATAGGETPIEITIDEKKNVADLMARLGLS